MLEPIRLATPEEVQSIAETADLTPHSAVYAFDNHKTGKPDLAVVRQCVEIDPMCLAPDSNTARQVAFVWSLQNTLRAFGNTEFYFSVKPSDTEWLRNISKWGAQQVSTEPELRFRKNL